MKRSRIIVIVLCIVGGLLIGSGIAMSVSKGKAEKEAEKKQEQEASQETETTKDTEDTQVMQEVQPTTVVFTGDVLFSNYVLNNYDKKGINGVLSQNMIDTLNQSDILMINNEFPYSTRGTQAPDKQYTFRVNPSYVTLLQQMGVDIAGLANNHVLDYGKDALADTFSTLDGAGIAYTGAGNSLEEASKLIVKEVNGKKFGFLAASRVIPVGSWNVENSQPGVFTTYDPTKLIAAIEQARTQCDYVYVSVHWGTEHTDVLTSYQQAMAHQFIDAGADAVIGAHPHVLQGMEYYNGKPIFYSLGNFIFNQAIARTTAVEFTIAADGTVVVRLLPASAEGAYTHEVTGEQAQSIYTYLESISSTVAIDENGVVTSR